MTEYRCVHRDYPNNLIFTALAPSYARHFACHLLASPNRLGVKVPLHEIAVVDVAAAGYTPEITVGACGVIELDTLEAVR